MTVHILHERIKKKSLQCRNTVWINESPRSMITESLSYKKKRLKIILTNNTCTSPTCTMCPLPNYKSFSQLSIKDQLNIFFGVAKKKEVTELAIYNDGSFFGPEISAEIRNYIAECICKLNIHKLSIESLPQYLFVDEVPLFLKKINKTVAIELSIGLQTFSDNYRKILLGSQFNLEEYEKAAERVVTCGYLLRTHVLSPLPLLTIRENLVELNKTLKYLTTIRSNFISVCLLRPQENTLVGSWHSHNLVLPPWTGLINYIKENLSRQGAFKFDGLPNFTCGENDFPWQMCNKCWNSIVLSIKDANRIKLQRCDECEAFMKKIESNLITLGSDPIKRAARLI